MGTGDLREATDLSDILNPEGITLSDLDEGEAAATAMDTLMPEGVPEPTTWLSPPAPLVAAGDRGVWADEPPSPKLSSVLSSSVGVSSSSSTPAPDVPSAAGPWLSFTTPPRWLVVALKSKLLASLSLEGPAAIAPRET